MDYIEVLPRVALDPAQPFGASFQKKGITTLPDAARYLKDMKYGYASSRNLEEALEKGEGTCFHKHGILSLCALEIGVPVHKALGIYPMDAALVPSIASVLSASGFTYVPASHCFLVYGNYRIDLTEGNCNGKTGPIDAYFHIQIVPPDLGEEEEREIYRLFVKDRWRLIRTDNGGGTTDVETVIALLNKCSRAMKLEISCGMR